MCTLSQRVRQFQRTNSSTSFNVRNFENGDYRERYALRYNRPSDVSKNDSKKIVLYITFEFGLTKFFISSKILDRLFYD